MGGKGGANFLEQKIYGVVILNERTFDQIMPKWVRSFMKEFI